MPPVGWVTYSPWLDIGVTKGSRLDLHGAVLTTFKPDGSGSVHRSPARPAPSWPAQDRQVKLRKIPAVFRQHGAARCSRPASTGTSDRRSVSTPARALSYDRRPCDHLRQIAGRWRPGLGDPALVAIRKAARRINQLCGGKADFIAPQWRWRRAAFGCQAPDGIFCCRGRWPRGLWWLVWGDFLKQCRAGAGRRPELIVLTFASQAVAAGRVALVIGTNGAIRPTARWQATSDADDHGVVCAGSGST